MQLKLYLANRRQYSWPTCVALAETDHDESRVRTSRKSDPRTEVEVRSRVRVDGSQQLSLLASTSAPRLYPGVDTETAPLCHRVYGAWHTRGGSSHLTNHNGCHKRMHRTYRRTATVPGQAPLVPHVGIHDHRRVCVRSTSLSRQADPCQSPQMKSHDLKHARVRAMSS